MQENWGSTHNNSTVAIKLIVVEIQLWGNKKLIVLGLLNYDCHDCVACFFHPQHWIILPHHMLDTELRLGSSGEVEAHRRSPLGTLGDPSRQCRIKTYDDLGMNPPGKIWKPPNT